MQFGGKVKKFVIWLIAAVLVGSPLQAMADQRSESDQPDLFSGFQIKPIYLLPADSQDTRADVNGEIASLLVEGNSFVEREISKSFVIDTRLDGSFDIQFLRTKALAKDLQSMQNTDLTDLLIRSKLIGKNTENRKIYIFFVPVESGIEEVCGYAPTPGIASVVLMGDGRDYELEGCDGPSRGFSHWAAGTWVHEVFHNLGVDHTKEPCDLMSIDDTCPEDQVKRIDPSRSLYVGATLYGPDILKLPVWKDSNSSNLAKAECQLFWGEKSKVFDIAICPLGKTVKLGAREFCWTGRPSFVLQTLVNGKWKKLKVGSPSRLPWGSDDWECDAKHMAPSATVRSSKAGAVSYRWVTNNRPEKSFVVYWLK